MNDYREANVDSSSEIKYEARNLLKGRWTEAVIIAFIPTIFSFLFFRNISDANSSSILYELIEGFLLSAVTFSFMNLARNRDYIIRPVEEILTPFNRKYFKNLLFLKLWKYLFVSLWTLLFVVPGIVKAYSYSQAELLYKDHVDRTGEQPNPRMILRESSDMMNGYKGALFFLDLSFFGWMILNGLTFGLLGLWLTPYREMSRVVFYEILLTKHNNVNQNTDRLRQEREAEKKKYEEVGKNPNDFRDFEDF